MTILLAALLVVGVMIAVPAPVAAQQGMERHSGTVVSVDPAGRTLTLQELIEDGRPRRLEVRVSQGALVVLSERIPEDQAARLDAAFVERRIDLAEVRAGDFVVIEGVARGGTATASTVVVTLRAGAAEAAPAASPATQSRP
jgi:hypothetical protein